MLVYGLGFSFHASQAFRVISAQARFKSFMYQAEAQEWREDV